MSETADLVRGLMRPLIQQARDEGKWLWCRYQGLWFSPNELEAHNNSDHFLWGPVNWKLRDPAEYVTELRREVRNKNDELYRVEQRVKASQ